MFSYIIPNPKEEMVRTLEVKSADEGNAPLGNRLYRYELVDNKLVGSPQVASEFACHGVGHS